MRDYRSIARDLDGLEIPSRPGFINILWMAGDCIAVGRAHGGGYVLVLPGAPLATTKPELSKALSHDQWQTKDGTPVEGNRISLPEGQPFAMATATVATELIRQGIEKHPLEEVFQAVDDFIERLLGELLVSEHALAGLLGELLLLERMLRVPELCDAVADPTAPWRGYLHDARDFRRGSMSIEVKTTTGDMRIHTIHSLAQIEPRRDGEGLPIETVFLLSLGLRPESTSGNYTVPDTVDKIVAHLDRCTDPAAAKEAFFDRLSRWGVTGQAGYDHESARANPRLSTRFSLSLEPLLYQLADPRLHLLRSEDLVDFIVEPQGVRYRAKFPPSVPGSPGNPVAGWAAALDQIDGTKSSTR